MSYEKFDYHWALLVFPERGGLFPFVARCRDDEKAFDF